MQNALCKKRRWEQWHLRSGWYRNSPTWCLGAGHSLRPPGAFPIAPLGPQSLTCVITLWLAFLQLPRPSLHNKRIRKLRESSPCAQPPAPSPKRTLRGCPGSPPTTPSSAWPGHRSAPGKGSRLSRAASPLRAPSVPCGPGLPSAPPHGAPRLPLSPPESCFHGSLGRPLLPNSLSSPVPIPPPLGTSLRRSAGDSHHTPTSDPRLREAQGGQERSVARSAPRGCVKGPSGPETTSPTRLPCAPVAIHPRLSCRLALLPALSPSPARLAPKPCGPRPARLPRASASSSPARCL